MAAANTTFIIYNTAGAAVSAIQPNTLDGPGGVQQNSDLRMYGLGFPNWGEGVDENDYHLTENFACPALLAFPSSVRYLLLGPVVAAKTPAGQATDELGVGNGINTPLLGQFWYNTTAQQMFCNTSTGWTATAGVTSITAGTGVTLTGTVGVPIINIGQAVGTTDVPTFAGTTMNGILTMVGNRITNLANPTASQDATTKSYVDAAVSGGGAGVYVPLAGGTMTGTLTMSSAGITINNGPGLTANSTNVTVNSGTITVNSPTSGVAMTANGRIANVTTLTTSDAVTATYGDGRWLNKSVGGTVTGTTTFTQPVTIPATPTVSTQAASKSYVDTQVASALVSALATAVYGTVGHITIPATPNNFIIQWGFSSVGTGYGTIAVTFPITFPNAPLVAVCSTANRTSGTSSGSGFVSSLTNTGMTILVDQSNVGQRQGYWIALGH